jgi:methionyl-tRNA formyltransferase
MRVLVLGRAEILYEVMRAVTPRHQIVGLITAPSRPEYLRTETDYETFATSVGAPFVLTNRLDTPEVEAMLQTAEADVAISVNWVSIVHAPFISRFRFGVINAHFGDLPRYRGNAVTNWALLAGESEIALTIHEMSAGELDAGPILSQSRMPVSSKTTIADVNAFAANVVPRLFSDVLDSLADGTLRPQPQEQSGVIPFRCYPRLPSDSIIHWTDSAVAIDRLVRASTHPYSGAYTIWLHDGVHPQRLTVWESRVVAARTADIGSPGHVIQNDRESGESWVLTGCGILALKRVQLDEEPEFLPGLQWRSIRMRLGVTLEDAILALTRLKGTRS